LLQPLPNPPPEQIEQERSMQSAIQPKHFPPGEGNTFKLGTGPEEGRQIITSYEIRD